MSPSCGPIVPLLLYVRLIPLFGSPMLSTMLAIACGGTTPRTVCSTWSNSAAVSSMRVPIGARTWIAISPASTDGKKLRPSHGPARTTRPPPRGTAQRNVRGGRVRDQARRGSRRAVPRSGARTPLERDERIACAWRRNGTMRRERGRRMRGMRLQQVAGHHRHERARQHERSDHREDHGFGHRHEQEAGHAVEQQHRHEHDADAQQRHEGRRDDLRRAVEDRIAHHLPCSRCQFTFSIVTVASSTRMPTASAARRASSR